jgi:NAD(P)-dependent dehydrogenase (short-subunit alcohol dehydrogenase family)
VGVTATIKTYPIGRNGSSMPLPLEGRTAVITGAASGIGKAFAVEAAARGMRLALADIDGDALREVADELARQTGVIQRTLDVRKREELDAFAAQLRTDSIALVFANAGVMRAGTSWQLSAQDWELVLDVNVKGAMNTVSAFMPALLAQPAPSRVVFTGSTSAFMPRPKLASYSGSKHALWGIAEAMALELAEINALVGVSFLAPSAVKTPIASRPLAGANFETQKQIGELLEAFGTPAAEVASYTFDAIAQGRFWILPHPEFKEAVIRRAQYMCDERDPS